MVEFRLGDLHAWRDVQILRSDRSEGSEQSRSAAYAADRRICCETTPHVTELLIIEISSLRLESGFRSFLALDQTESLAL